MKDLKELNVLTFDYGTFIDLSVMFAPHVNKSWIYTPFEKEYLDIKDCCKGDGIPNVERVDDYMDPDFLKDIDLIVFPDRGYPGHQKYFRSIGKKVWGSLYTCELEEYRTMFLKTIKDMGMPVLPSVTIRGLSKLAEHLKGVDNKWVKINRYRSNVETFHHQDYAHTARILDGLHFEFGPLAEGVVFIVQDPLDGDDDEPVIEIGYDGWNIFGEYPDESFQGYERKNELYLGSKLKREDLPDAVAYVNEKMAPVYKAYGYCNFVATEIRKKGELEAFTDPTTRMAGQTEEHLLNTCTNLPLVIWLGVHGEVIKPEFSHDFAAEATLHYTDDTKDGWRTLRIPDEVRPFIKLYHYCMFDGLYHFPPRKNDEVGVMIGNGDTVEEAFDNLKEHLDIVEDEPVKAELKGFADLLEQIQDAEDQNVQFSDQPVPKPSEVL